MPSAVKDQEIAAEQQRVDEAYARLEEMRADAQQMIKEGYRQALAGTKAALVDRDAMVFQASARAQALDVADDGLVFGRLDLLSREIRYIGRIGVRTREHDSLVIDWRAPAAEAFYRATPEDPQGIVRRRVLHSRGHSVIDLEDDLLDPGAADGLTVVGDGAFLASLARTREGTMRDIVATIQREQDEVIRAPADGTVVVRGGPGTGKTAVALHRVAYLLFRHRRRFGTRGVLIIGPNRRFTNYIERVLPSLGEGSATLRSLGDLTEGVSATHHDPAELLRLKGSGAMAKILRRAVGDHPPGAPDQLTVVHAGVVVRMDRRALDRVRRAVHQRARGSVNRSRQRAGEMLQEALWARFQEIGGLSDAPGTSRRDFVMNVRDQQRFTDFLPLWWPIRTPLQVLRSLSDPDRLRAAAGRDLTREQAEHLAADWRGPAPEDGQGELSYQDIALLDEIDALLGKPPRLPRIVSDDDDDPYVLDGTNIITGESTDQWEPGMRELSTAIERSERSRRVDDGVEEKADYGHIVVDEAQDLSPMQWRMLGRRGRQATWTVVEDPAQSSWEDLDSSRQAMTAALGTRVRYDFELTTNYRNSVEIAAVATRVLARAVPDAKPAGAVRVSGHPPNITLTSTADDTHTSELLHAAREGVVDLLGQVEGTIGVILPLGYGARTVAAEWDWDLPDRVQVLDVLEAKGLEFDAALIVAPEEISAQSPTGLRTLYVAVSRATQRLTVLTTSELWRDYLR
jgi:DNA helicase IV